jgi:PilZ domain
MPHYNKSVDRRQYDRRPTKLFGVLILPGRAKQWCAIENMSDTGALIVFDRLMLLPAAFQLTAECDSGKTDFYCEIRHHFGDRVGVEFVTADRIEAHKASSWILHKS